MKKEIQDAAVGCELRTSTPLGSLLTSLSELEPYCLMRQDAFMRASFRDQQAAARLLHTAIESAGECAFILARHYCPSEKGYYNWDYAVRTLESTRHIQSELSREWVSLKEVRGDLAHKCWEMKPESIWSNIQILSKHLLALATSAIKHTQNHDALHDLMMK